ncbi:MAG: hypothetical protein M1839_007145 [Geoglossum umbratile]|nr:MAG: hypothetical protein M1839_007145 [Geoglossum umbratile]
MASFDERSFSIPLSNGSIVDAATTNPMVDTKRLSLPQMPAAIEEEEPVLPGKLFWCSRSRLSRRAKSARSSIFRLKERPTGSVFGPDRHELHRRTRSPPTRSVHRMVEPFPLILPDRRSNARGPESYTPTPPSLQTPNQSTHDVTRRLDAPAAAETHYQQLLPTSLGNPHTPRSATTYLDVGMFPPEGLQAVYLQVQSKDQRPSDTDYPCSQQGSPCEEICIFKDFADTQERPPNPSVSDAPSERFSCSPGNKINASGAPVRIETSTFETEGGWLAGQADCGSWLDDSSSCGDLEHAPSPVRPARRKPPRVTSWVSDSTDSSFEKNGDSFEYATALAPSRPRLVDISSRPTSHLEVSAWSPDSSTQTTQTRSINRPLSPPPTPVDEQPLERDSYQASTWGVSGQMGDSIGLQSSGNPTPPTTPERTHRPLTIASKGVPKIISMLEDALRTFPSTMLQLHTQPISLIRKMPPPHPPLSGAPQLPFPFPPPHLGWPSRPSESATPPPRPPLASKNLHQLMGIDEATTGIAVFGKIFSSTPDSTDFLHTALYTHIVALNFLNDLVATPFDHPPIQFPPKALSTLGAIEPVEGQGQLYDRICKVTTALRVCVGRLLEACSGKSRGDEMLLKALREIVRLVESRNGARELFLEGF